MTKQFQATLVLDARATLGECPRWNAEAQLLYWVDIDGCALHRFDPRSGVNDTMPIGEHIGCFAQDARGGFIAGLRSGYAHIDQFGGAVTKLSSPAYDSTKSRFNDGRCDGAGRFWAAGLWDPRDGAFANVYCLEADGRFSARANSVIVGNGITFSPDGKMMTLADTTKHVLWAFDYDTEFGTPSNRRELRTYEPASGRPDGACVDAEGNIYVAIFAGARVEKLSPKGELLAVINTPVPNPTCCTFGGKDLRTLYITTARTRMTDDELAAKPEAGGVFSVRIEAADGASGVPEMRYGSQSV